MSKELPQITKAQAIEWCDNPVTIWFRKTAENHLEEAEACNGVDAFYPFEPQKTQEVIAGLNACADTWALVIAACTKETVEEEFDELPE